MTLLLRHYDMAGEMTGDGNMLRMNPRPVGYNMGVTNANTNTKTGTVLPTYNPNLPPSAIPVTGTYTATPYTPAPYNPGF